MDKLSLPVVPDDVPLAVHPVAADDGAAEVSAGVPMLDAGDHETRGQPRLYKRL
ncbi:MAG: hypothetical protein H6811_05390 [Phycisphaeraceae bacterium]|nr:hypothetical protein [Phycisphaeraceae bacterium]